LGDVLLARSAAGSSFVRPRGWLLSNPADQQLTLTAPPLCCMPPSGPIRANDVQEKDEKLFDVVDEGEYARRVNERREKSDFVVDDSTYSCWHSVERAGCDCR
jgi:hypothetical protein